MSPLYHYTCIDGHRGITNDGGLIRPGIDGLVWLTDMAVPIPDALGLTRVLIPCDRTQYRWTVPHHAAQHFSRYRRANPAREHLWLALIYAPGARPAHWWVTEEPVTGTPPALGRVCG